MMDFFFGKTNLESDGLEFPLSNFIELAQGSPSRYFTIQVERLLKTSNGYIVLNHGTSYPDFCNLLKNFENEYIGMIEIGSRIDVNSNVDATVDCTLYFNEGAISIRPHWCAYKEIRADEIISTLLAPLIRYKFLDRTYFKIDGKPRKLLSSDLEVMVESVMKVSRYPYQDADSVGRWVKQLSDITDGCIE